MGPLVASAIRAVANEFSETQCAYMLCTGIVSDLATTLSGIYESQSCIRAYIMHG